MKLPEESFIKVNIRKASLNPPCAWSIHDGQHPVKWVDVSDLVCISDASVSATEDEQAGVQQNSLLELNCSVLKVSHPAPASQGCD